MSQIGPNGRSNVHAFRPRGAPPDRPPGREPAFSAPWPPLAMAAAIVAFYALQSTVGGGRAAAPIWGVIPPHVLAGQVWTLVTHLFVHGDWVHAILNAVAALAFGAPIARRWGGSGSGAARFFGFYLLCGVLAAVGYILLHPGEARVLAGASGAVAGLMGAASRMMADPYGLSPLSDRRVIGFGVGWLVLNLIFAVLGVIPGFGAAIAWEAHLIGYAAGLFLIAPFGRLTRAPR